MGSCDFAFLCRLGVFRFFKLPPRRSSHDHLSSSSSSFSSFVAATYYYIPSPTIFHHQPPPSTTFHHLPPPASSSHTFRPIVELACHPATQRRPAWVSCVARAKSWLTEAVGGRSGAVRQLGEGQSAAGVFSLVADWLRAGLPSRRTPSVVLVSYFFIDLLLLYACICLSAYIAYRF